MRLQKDVAKLLKGAKSVVDDDDEEGTDPRLTLKTRFSAVKPKYFRQIRDNIFDPLNISRLYNDVTISRSYKAKYIDLGKNIEVKMKEEDATESNIKGLALLLRGLFVYSQIQLHLLLFSSHQSIIQSASTTLRPSCIHCLYFRDVGPRRCRYHHQRKTQDMEGVWFQGREFMGDIPGGLRRIYRRCIQTRQQQLFTHTSRLFTTARCLGAKMEPELSFSEHFTTPCKKRNLHHGPRPRSSLVLRVARNLTPTVLTTCSNPILAENHYGLICQDFLLHHHRNCHHLIRPLRLNHLPRQVFARLFR